MRNSILPLLLCCPMLSDAEVKKFALNPGFNTAENAEFVTFDGDRGQTIKGSLISQDGMRFALPDTCEPEGGAAELKDAFTVRGENIYFLFICAWPVQHLGLGLNGTQYETFVYMGSDLASIENVKMLSQDLSAYEGRLERGGNSYAWDTRRELSARKITEIESGTATDSVVLAHGVVLARLKDMDYNAIIA